MAKNASSLSNSSRSQPENLYKVIPKLLPNGEVLGWNLTKSTDPSTKRNRYTFMVCVQTNRTAALEAHIVETKCDGPCGNKMPSNHMITMGKCDHNLCRACFGLVKNPDGSFGCSNFYCWADFRESFRHEKEQYREILKKQSARARELRTIGENVRPCTEANLPVTPCRTPTNMSPEVVVKPKMVKTTKVTTLSSSARSSCPTTAMSDLSDTSSSQSSRKNRRKKSRH